MTKTPHNLAGCQAPKGRGLAVASRVVAAAVAGVWLYHGLYNKLLGGEPRHLAILQSVPGLGGFTGQLSLLTVGAIEVVVALWVLLGTWPRPCAAAQTVALLSMNVAELAWSRPHLLWPAGLIPINLMFLAAAWVATELRVRSMPMTRCASRRAPGLLQGLRRHPFAVRARFDDVLVLTYALPAEVLRPLLPPELALDTYKGYGFVAIAMVQARALRPRALPARVGRDFFLAGYRVFARYRRPDGRTIRGLRILRSDTDSPLMTCAGNLLTHYNYRTSDLRVTRDRDRLDIRIDTRDGAADLHVTADLATEGRLPPGSPFADVRNARRFAGPLPWTFDYEPRTHSIVAIQGVRKNWSPTLVSVTVHRNTFFDAPQFRSTRPILASAFHVSGIDYEWRPGTLYPLKEQPS